MYRIEFKLPKGKKWGRLSVASHVPFSDAEIARHRQGIAETTTAMRGVAVMAAMVQIRQVEEPLAAPMSRAYKAPYVYRGWTVEYKPNNPASSTWTAVKFGVGMNNNDESALGRMIDQKEKDAAIRADDSAEWGMAGAIKAMNGPLA